MPNFKVIEIQPEDKKALMSFIKFPDELYKGCQQYVPALHSDQVNSLTRVSSLSYCSRRMWMVMDGEKPVGRICGMINPRYNERYNKKCARFGWFDCINNLEVAKLLIGTAEAWAREQGMTQIHGPLYYNTLGKQGMLYEGYHNIPPFNCIYNYPYYNDLVTALGFEKECDWIQYKVRANHGVPPKAERISKMLIERYNLHIGDLDELKKDPEKVRGFFRMYSESFSDHVYNFIPFTDEEIEEEAKSVMPFISNKISSIVMDENDEPVAFGISFPSISVALQKAKGKLFPFGWFHLLRAMKNYYTTDLMLSGAVPAWQNKGISAVFATSMSVKAIKEGNFWGITNPQIDTNDAANLWTSYEHEVFMRRRCYIKNID